MTYRTVPLDWAVEWQTPSEFAVAWAKHLAKARRFGLSIRRHEFKPGLHHPTVVYESESLSALVTFLVGLGYDEDIDTYLEKA